MAEKGQFGTEMFGYTLYGNPTNQYQPRNTRKAVLHSKLHAMEYWRMVLTADSRFQK
mgnify:CR=1 FL=1